MDAEYENNPGCSQRIAADAELWEPEPTTEEL